MPIRGLQAVAAVFGAVALVGLSCATPAAAAEDWGINGTFATSSNGDWAKVNERYQDQPSERSTWTISTTCISPTECSGTVQSDAGWAAAIYTTDGLWYVKRTIPNWRFCADGAAIEGFQEYKIYPIGPDGRYDVAGDEYTGQNRVIGPSGSCGRNQWPVISMPFYMKRL
ncbi:Rv2253/PknI dimerization domain-containing protein [Mycolicibacterium sp. CBM1]